MAVIRFLLLGFLLVNAWAADVRTDVAALDDPAQRDHAWERLVEASSLHGLIDGHPVRVWPTASGASSRLVIVEPPPTLQNQPFGRPDRASDLWPGLDLTALLPEEGCEMVPDPTLDYGRLSAYRVADDGGIAPLAAEALLDLDGDGAAESLSLERTAIAGHQDVFGIIIRRYDTPSPRVVFHLLCPHQELGWQQRVRQVAGGVVIQAGPASDAGLQPVVTIAWDPRSRDWTWTGPPAARRVPPEADPAAVTALAAERSYHGDAPRRAGRCCPQPALCRGQPRGARHRGHPGMDGAGTHLGGAQGQAPQRAAVPARVLDAAAGGRGADLRPREPPAERRGGIAARGARDGGTAAGSGGGRELVFSARAR